MGKQPPVFKKKNPSAAGLSLMEEKEQQEEYGLQLSAFAFGQQEQQRKQQEQQKKAEEWIEKKSLWS